jgi:transcriptional regulator with XRE-family HTH domain
MPLMIRKNLLREIRRERRLSGYDLQLLSHIDAQAIYQIERGIKRPQSYEKNLLAEALGLRVEELFPKEMEKNREVHPCHE